MLGKLQKTLDTDIVDILRDTRGWQSLYIDYHKPYVERLWKDIGDVRLSLHRILPCEKVESLNHRHPWPMASYIVAGTYHEEWGVGDGDLYTKIGTHVRVPCSLYEMTDPRLRHCIYGQENVLTIMLTGKPWKKSSRESLALGGLTQGCANTLREDILRELTSSRS